LGDGLGVLLVTPLLLSCLQGACPPLERRLEAAALLALTLLLALWIFSEAAGSTDTFYKRAFLLTPLPVWAAVRFGVRGAASIMLVIAAIAIVATLHGLGPLVLATPKNTALLLQEYLALQAFTSLALAALLQELQQRGERLRIREQAIGAINDGVVVLDAGAADMPVAYANPAFKAMPGPLADAVLARSRRALQDDAGDTSGSGSVGPALRVGHSVRTLLHERGQDGTEFWNELRIDPVRNARGEVTHYVAIQRDMSDVKHNEAKLRAAHDALDRLNRELEARVEARTHELQRANEHLEELASIDPLTGASNRRHFLAQAQVEISRARRLDLALSVIMVDIDFFKTINDRYGHEAGDKVLAALSTTIHATLRGGDIFARLGGEEFIVMLPGQALSDAVQMAERLRLLIAQTEVPGCPAHITVSAGVAGLVNAMDEGIDGLLRRADRALYQAKEQGRNQVCVAPAAQDTAAGA